MSRTKHPECGDDEVFITNADMSTWPRIGWSTKRRGKVAYDVHRKEIGSRWTGCFPVFAGKDEIRKSSPKLLETLENRDFVLD